MENLLQLLDEREILYCRRGKDTCKVRFKTAIVLWLAFRASQEIVLEKCGEGEDGEGDKWSSSS